MRHRMTNDHRVHMYDIVLEVGERIKRKYTAGQHEHGGQLWLKKGLLEMARQEADDLETYLTTLANQKGTCPHCGGEITQNDFGEIDETE